MIPILIFILIMTSFIAIVTGAFYSYGAYVISCISLFLGLGNAWYTWLKPARIQGSLRYMVIWVFSSNHDGNITDRKMAPKIWLTNTGSNPEIIEDIRLVFKLNCRSNMIAYPVGNCPKEALDNAGSFSDYGMLNDGTPYCGFILNKHETKYLYNMYGIKSEEYESLEGVVEVELQIKNRKTLGWDAIYCDKFNFGKKGYNHSIIMQGAGSTSRPIYSQLHQSRYY